MATETGNEDREDVIDKIPVQNWWHMLLYAWDLVEFNDRFETEIKDAPDLRALLTKMLVFLTKHQIRRGLRGDYVEMSEDLRGVRGRIDFGETLRGLTMYRGRLHCEFEEFTLNVPRNQIIRSTLNDSLNQGFTQIKRERRDKYGTLISDVESLLRMLYEIDRVRVTRRLIASELRLLGRNEREYKLMLKICEMLQDPSMPQSNVASDLDFVNWMRKKQDEHKIFEKFVANFYKLRLGNDWRVSSQGWQYWNETADDRIGNIRLPIMQPDVVLVNPLNDKIVVLDTKWYKSPVDSGRGDDAVHTDNLYQMYGYLASQDHRGDEYPSATGILLYGQTETGHQRLRTRIDKHPFWVETLNLMQDWEKIEMDLQGLVNETIAS